MATLGILVRTPTPGGVTRCPDHGGHLSCTPIPHRTPDHRADTHQAHQAHLDLLVPGGDTETISAEGIPHHLGLLAEGHHHHQGPSLA